MFLYITAILRLHNTIVLSKFNKMFSYLNKCFLKISRRYLFNSVSLRISNYYNKTYKNNWHEFYKAQKQEISFIKVDSATG